VEIPSLLAATGFMNVLAAAMDPMGTEKALIDAGFTDHLSLRPKT